ncbi:hypothetical protein T310_5533, partial [Rasamsonia emersonii CBS 393.64]
SRSRGRSPSRNRSGSGSRSQSSCQSRRRARVRPRNRRRHGLRAIRAGVRRHRVVDSIRAADAAGRDAWDADCTRCQKVSRMYTCICVYIPGQAGIQPGFLQMMDRSSRRGDLFPRLALTLIRSEVAAAAAERAKARKIFLTGAIFYLFC